jgi:hypothetical protein
MSILTEVHTAVKRCIACPGCNKATSSAQCDYHCEKWLTLRIKEMSYASKQLFKIPVSV